MSNSTSSNLLFFVGGLTLGIMLSYMKLNDFSFSQQLAHFSSVTPCSFDSQMLIMPNVTAPTSNINRSQTPQLAHIAGLKQYLKPPKVFHDRNDTELLWRGSVTPQIAEYPFLRVPKVAFLFMTRGPVLLAPLWEKFFKGHQGLYSIYVHSTPSYKASLHPESPVLHGRRIPSQEVVECGEVSQVWAERRLLSNALLDISNQRFVQLSESCIPIYNFSTVYSLNQWPIQFK